MGKSCGAVRSGADRLSYPFLPERHDSLRDEFLALDYSSYLDDDTAGKLNLFPNQWKKIEALLAR
jgi:hypothetical protein